MKEDAEHRATKQTCVIGQLDRVPAVASSALLCSADRDRHKTHTHTHRPV
jgi:hypothetical protein